MYSYYNHFEQSDPLAAGFYALNNPNSELVTPTNAWAADYAANINQNFLPISPVSSGTSSLSSSRQSSGDSYCAKPTATSMAWTPQTESSPADIFSAEPEEFASLSPMQIEQGESSQTVPRALSASHRLIDESSDHQICYVSKEQLAVCTCGKQFKRKYAVNSLKRHIREKAKEAKSQLYHCSLCDFANVRHSNLDQHYITQHPLAPCSYCKYKCHICGKSFDTQDDLDRHVENKHRY